MRELIGKKILVTTNAWFFAPDGKEYRGIWGTLRACHEDEKLLGFKVNRSHANWFLEIGDTMIAGCQVHYAVQCDNKPPDMVSDWINEKPTETFMRPSKIYFSE